MASGKPAETIQTLLEAEEGAKTAIEEARKQRDMRLKEAATEADAEITAYRSTKESEYKAMLQKLVGATDATSEQIAAEAKESIKHTISSARGRKVDVVQMLVGYVKTVNTEV